MMPCLPTTSFVLKWPSMDPLTSLFLCFGHAIQKALAALRQSLLVYVVVFVIHPAIPSIVFPHFVQSMTHKLNTFVPSSFKILLLRSFFEGE